MDVSTIENLIGNLGFSLVACGFMGFFIYRIWERFQISNTEVTKTLVEVNSTNKELAHTNKMLVENFKTDMIEIKKDVQDIKEKVSK